MPLTCTNRVYGAAECSQRIRRVVATVVVSCRYCVRYGCDFWCDACSCLGAYAQRQVADLVHDDVVLAEDQTPGQGEGVAVRAHDVLVAVAVEPEPAVPIVGDGTDPQPAVPWAGPTNDEPG